MNFLKPLAREIVIWTECFIRNIPGSIGFALRFFYYCRRSKNKFHNNRFETGLRVECPKNLELGSYSYFGYQCKIYLSLSSSVRIGSNCEFNSNVMINSRGKGSIYIGDNVLIGPNVVLRSSDHSFDNLKTKINEQGMNDGKIIVEDNV